MVIYDIGITTPRKQADTEVKNASTDKEMTWKRLTKLVYMSGYVSSTSETCSIEM